MGTKDWTDTALVECLSDNLPLSSEQRSILITLVVERAKQDKDADRYRWLRREKDLGDHGAVWQALCGGGYRMKLDAAIDAAMTPNV